MNQGYKGMIRDRCPEVIDLALKWCKAKERWVDRVYSTNVRLYKTEDEKSHAVRLALGIHEGKQRSFNFADSINLSLLGFYENYTGERHYWLWVTSWVNWFVENYKYWANIYSYSTKEQFMKRFTDLYLEELKEDCPKLAYYLIKSFT